MNLTQKLTVQEIEKRRSAYEVGATIYEYSKKYAETKDDYYLEQINTLDKIHNRNDYPLPSGRIGNVIGILLETNQYTTLNSILEKKDEFSYDLENVSMNYDGSNVWGFDDVFEFSLLGFDSEYKTKEEVQYLPVEMQNQFIELHNEKLRSIVLIYNKIISKINNMDNEKNK